MKRILVIKLGALGDIFATTSAFEAIRKHHPSDHITLLTTPPYENFAQQLGYFDDIWFDKRAKLTHVKKLWDFGKKLRSGAFDRVYDLQMVDRTNFYCHLIGFLMGAGQRPEWVGTAWGASHRYHLPKTPTYHQDRLQGLLEKGGITPLPPLNLTRLAGDIRSFPVKFPYVLFAPGASQAHRHTKCWPLERYAEVAGALLTAGLTPVIVGSSDENNRTITDICPEAIDLTGKTKLMDVITLATHAAFAIGNDTGPMHIASTCLCPVLVVFFGKNDPNAGGPRGVFYRHLYAPEKEKLPSRSVLELLPQFIESFKNRNLPQEARVTDL
jgi:ADP-heptose:LPS heptosyltransferase